jgi:hypothetical protein
MTGYRGYCQHKGRSINRLKKKGAKTNEEMASYFDRCIRFFIGGFRGRVYPVHFHFLSSPDKPKLAARKNIS